MRRINGHVHLIDDDQLMRASLAIGLREIGYLVHEYAAAYEFLDQSMKMSPEVIVMEMQFPDMTGLELQKKLQFLKRHTPIIFIASHAAPQQIVDDMKNGAVDFLFKPFALTKLIESIGKALKLDIIQSKALADDLKAVKVRERFNTLSPREKEVCHWIVKGLMNKEIAQKLGVTPSTIKIQKSKTLKKMNAASVQELSIAYITNHLENLT